MHCALTLLVGRQEGHPACKKTEWWGAGVVICLEQGAELHIAQLMPLPLIVSCFSKIQIGFTFLVPAHPGSPRKGLLNGCVCVRVRACVRVCAHCDLCEGLMAAVWMLCKQVVLAVEIAVKVARSPSSSSVSQQNTQPITSTPTSQ